MQKVMNGMLIAVLCLIFAACSSTPTYEQAFSANQQVPGSADSIAASLDATWGSSLEILAQQGFLIEQADAKSHIILAKREVRDANDKDLSYSISATLTLVPLGENITKVLVAANQTTEMHRKEYRWWKLLWLIPLIPTGTDYTTVVVNRDTVRSPQFYQDFFKALKKTNGDRSLLTAPASSPGKEQ